MFQKDFVEINIDEDKPNDTLEDNIATKEAKEREIYKFFQEIDLEYLPVFLEENIGLNATGRPDQI